MGDVLAVIMRWLHISSVAALIGGAIYGRFAAAAAIAKLDKATCEVISEDIASHARPLVYAGVAGLVLSGVYNLLVHPGHTARYFIILGIKLLLVLHVFAVMLLAVQPHAKRRARMMAGAAISGLVIIAISAYLRLYF